MALSPLSPPQKVESKIKRVGMVFAGGPAPAANAVISSAAQAFMRNGIEVLGIKHGYSNLVNYGPESPMVEGEHYFKFTPENVKRLRNSRGIVIGTARANPGKAVLNRSYLQNPEATKLLKTVYDGLCSLELDALISIGGDDTLKTANMLKVYQDECNPGKRRISVVHLPKTIDNDYNGIDFTFGFFTAVDFLANEMKNLLADGEASQRYFLCELMGRSAGWLAYGSAIAGEASLAISVEDIKGEYESSEEVTDPSTGETSIRRTMNLDAVVKRIVAQMVERENRGKHYGVLVLAEGLAELMPYEALKDIPRDDHGHIAVADVKLADRMSKLVMDEFKRQTGVTRKITSSQLGYESRCSLPLAYDVVLGSQLGVGAFRALVEKELNGVMVSVSGQLDLQYVDFDTLVDPDTLKTVVRFVPPESDFHKLVRYMEFDSPAD